MRSATGENFFEDFIVGTVFRCPTPRLLTDADRVAYIALTGDRSPLYCNADGIVHPLTVFHTVLGQTVRQISLNAIANLGYAALVWPKEVHTGDVITTEAEVIGLKENSNGQSGICYVRTTGRNQHGETVLSYVRWVMVRKRGTRETPFRSSPVIPAPAREVQPEDLPTPARSTLSERETGGARYFGDYRAGERIDHIDGMTINDSDHMMFTRLYQNSARVHFDAIVTGGTPLVYGGLPVSIGYAQSFNGLENRLGICAINGGTHSNPVHSGDTLYTITEVLASEKRGPDYGALRLRMVVTKNERPGDGFTIMIADKETGRQRHHPAVVLDLDYWDQMPVGSTREN